MPPTKAAVSRREKKKRKAQQAVGAEDIKRAKLDASETPSGKALLSKSPQRKGVMKFSKTPPAYPYKKFAHPHAEKLFREVTVKPASFQLIVEPGSIQSCSQSILVRLFCMASHGR